MDNQSSSPRTLATVSRACEVIFTLDELDGAGVTEIANRLDISKSSAHSYLVTLEKNHYVVKENGRYKLSLEFLYLGKSVRHRHVLYKHGKSAVEQLAEESEEYVHLMCEQHGLERNIYKVAGDNAVGDEYHTRKEQTADYLHFTATGKAVLAHLPVSRITEIIEEYGLVKKTPQTITDRETLLSELEQIRDCGYAVNDEEEVIGIRAVGVPICRGDGTVLGAMSVSGPTSRMTDELCYEKLPEMLIERANVTEASINMSDASQSL